MIDSRRRTARFYLLLFLWLPLAAAAAQAQPPFYRIGAPYPPVRDPRLTTDNGIPGTGSYYFLDYPWPSLREALQAYGFFGRRFNQTHAAALKAAGTQLSPALIRVHLPANAELRVGGQAMSQRGSWRRLVTPPLPAGFFEYEIEARWTEHGQDVHRLRSVRIAPGAEAVVDFLGGEEAPSTLPPPRPLPPR